MERVELLLPAGDKDSLRAAVANGADAVYLGTGAFNARRFAANFPIGTLPSVVDFCHEHHVRVFVTTNILVKNHELKDFFDLIGRIGASKADAVIVQDPCLIPFIRRCAPDCEVHLSTQATTTNKWAVPEGVDRVIVPRELSLEQIASMTKVAAVEMFVHGALCFSYSGQCLFSSMAGGRSGNRGRCAQPCRYMYNGEYPLSTKDLCMLEKLPDIIRTGVVSLKVEGRMRGPVYTGVVARIYRKYIDMFYDNDFKVDAQDIEELKMAFNREFTTGFAFNSSVVDPRYALNRGLFLGTLEGKKLRLGSDLSVGDGVTTFHEGVKTGNTVDVIRKGDKEVARAYKGDVVSIDVIGAKNGDPIFKTFSADLKTDLGPDISMKESHLHVGQFKLPDIMEVKTSGPPMLCVKVYTIEGAREADRAGADVIYYDIFRNDCQIARKNVTRARFFLITPRVMSDQDVEKAIDIVEKLRPDGVLVGERGFLSLLKKKGMDVEVHLDHSFNIFNDLDIAAYDGIPIISPELSFDELSRFRSKRFIAMVHGPVVLMTTKEPLQAKLLCDESGRKFKTRSYGDLVQILNCSDLGLFNKATQYLDIGINMFYLDLGSNVGKLVSIYRIILSRKRFNDKNKRHGYTTGHLSRGVD